MANRITQARKLAGLSQRELAQRMNLKPSTVSGYESGTYDPKSDGLTKIATICGVTVDYLLELTDDPRGNFTVTISDTDPQMDEIIKKCQGLTAQALEKVKTYLDDLRCNPQNLKKKPSEEG